MTHYRAYSEEKHKISDVIPLNFLLHFTDYKIHKDCYNLAKKLYAHKRAKLPTKDRRNYDRQAKHKPIERYQAQKMTKKNKKVTAVADANERQYVDALQQLLQTMLTSNQNPLKKLETDR